MGKKGIVRDFTEETRELILRQIEDTQENWREPLPLLTGALDTGTFFELMQPFRDWDRYRERIQFRNELTVRQVSGIWENVESIDRTFSHRIQSLQELAGLYGEEIQTVADVLRPDSGGRYGRLEVTAAEFEEGFREIEAGIEEQKIGYELEKLIRRDDKGAMAGLDCGAFEEQMARLRTGDEKARGEVGPYMLLALARCLTLTELRSDKETMHAIGEELGKRLEARGLPEAIQERYAREAGNIRVETCITEEALRKMGW